MPFKGKGAFNSPSGITYKWNGGGQIDGRNYTAANQLILSPAGTGTFAVWTTGTCGIPGASANVSGTTYNGIDINAPNGTLDTHVVRQNQSYSPNYPNTPDQVMGGASTGYPTGTLMNMAQSGVAGSRYVHSTNGNTSLANLNGITYIDYSGGTLGDVNGYGILVINNLTNNLISVATSLHDNFAGIVIFSNNVNFSVKQGGVVGMVIAYGDVSNAGITLSDLTINGQGYIHYSSEAILNALKSVWSPKIVWFER
jgi:hypothetical protein